MALGGCLVPTSGRIEWTQEGGFLRYGRRSTVAHGDNTLLITTTHGRIVN